MVVFEELIEQQKVICKSDKSDVDLTIRKAPGGNIFFEIVPVQGVVPFCLSGKYSSIKTAKEAVQSFDNLRKETFGARTKIRSEERKQRKNGASTPTEGN